MDEVQPRVARAMMWAALCLIFLIRLLVGLVNERDAAALALAALSYPPLVVLLWRPWRARVRYALVVLVAVLALLPFVFAGTAWEWMPWTIGVALLVGLPGRAAAVLFGALLAAVLAAGLLVGDPVSAAVSRVTATVNDGLIVFSLHTLAAMVRDLVATRGELSRLAALRERLRLDGELRGTVGAELRVIADLLAHGRDAETREAVERARRALAHIRTVAGAYRAAHRSGTSGIRSPRIAWWALFGVLAMQATSAAASVAVADAPQLFVTVPVSAAVIAAYLAPRLRFRIAAVAVLSLPIAWPGMYFVPAWAYVGGLWGFIIGLAFATMRRPAACAVAVGVFALDTTAFLSPLGLPPADIVMGLVSDLILGGLVYSLTRLGELVAILRRARHELADEAVTRERQRIARDLHDVLGFSLSAVALRGELALRLAERDPGRAAAELASLRELVGRSADELHSITDDRVRLRLADEVEEARGVLASAGVLVETTVLTGPLDRETDTALAAVLRESVTNVLRHSRARTCTIVITETDGRILLTVTNDGVGPTVPQRRSGTGLAGLSARTGGRLTAARLPGGRFELVAEFGTASLPEPSHANSD